MCNSLEPPERALRRIADLHMASTHLRPDPQYLDNPQIGRSLRREQREAVVTFNSEVAEDFGLNQQTAALAMNYFDRYCSALVADHQSIPRERVQLLSMTCLMMASKLLDRHTPSIDDMCKIAQHIYAPDQFRAQELEILNRLNWSLHVPMPHTFLPMLLRIADMDEFTVGTKGMATSNISKWGCIFVDLTGFEYEFLRYSPLVIAYAALLCSARFEAIEPEHFFGATFELLRRRCGFERGVILSCAHAIMAYYELCFPNSPKAGKSSFMPVQFDEHGFNDRSDTTTPISIMVPSAAFGLQNSSKP